MPANNEYTFKVINPYKPKFLLPGMFDLFLFIGWIFFVIMANINPENPNIFAKFATLYFNWAASNAAFAFFVFALMVFTPVLFGRLIFNRYLLKYYLSKAKVSLSENHMNIEFISPKKNYCSSQTIYLNELKSYAISRAITIRMYSRGSGLIANMGICLVTEKGKIVFRLIDCYRLVPFLAPFNDIKDITKFSNALKNHIENYNLQNNNIIKFHVPVKWRCIPRTIFTVLAVLSVFVLFLWIIFSITLGMH